MSEQHERSEQFPSRETSSRETFIEMLNSRLPRKRAIAQGILRNEAGQILLCELTYKKDWDLPGGVVDPHESPADCVEREVREELGLTVHAGRLIAVNWLPPYRGWDDATLFLFDLGVVMSGAIDPERYLAREIKGAHWVAPGGIGEHVADYVTRHVAAALGAEHTAYLEDGRPRERGQSA